MNISLTYMTFKIHAGENTEGEEKKQLQAQHTKTFTVTMHNIFIFRSPAKPIWLS